jgi:hypothetical protein
MLKITVNQNILLIMSESLILPPLLSLFTIAKFWKVEREPIIEPPIQEE